MSGRMVFTTMTRIVRSSRRVVTVIQSPSLMPILFRQSRMNFCPRFGIWSTSAPIRRVCVPDKYWLTTRPVVRNRGIFFIDRIAAWTPFRNVEVRFAIMGIKLLVDEESRRAGVIERGAGPKNAHLLIHSLVGDAVVVGYTAPRSDSQFFENVGGILEWEVLPAAQPVRQLDDDVGVASRVARRVDALLPVNDAPFGTATEPVFFLMQAAGHNDIGVMRSFREKEINHAEEFQLRQRLAGEVRIGKRDKRVETHGEQSLDFAAVDSVHDFLRAVARLGKFFGLDAPDAGNVLASGGIRERTLPWKLVALLPMLASALAVSLAGNHRGTSALAPDISGGKSNVEHRQAILYAFGLMLQSPSVHA